MNGHCMNEQFGFHWSLSLHRKIIVSNDLTEYSFGDNPFSKEYDLLLEIREQNRLQAKYEKRIFTLLLISKVTGC